MVHKFDVSEKAKLDNPLRRVMLPPEETLKKLGLKTGETVADIGCGIGYFSIPAGKIVGTKGKVYALDIADEMLQQVDEVKKRNNLANIETVKVAEYDLKVANTSVSFAFTSMVLHEIEDLDRFCDEIKRILIEKGRLAVIEWEKKVSSLGPPIGHRISRDQLVAFFIKHGFGFIDYQSIGEEYYFVIMEKTNS